MRFSGKSIAVLALLLAPVLAACDQNQGGEPVARAQIGDGVAEPANPNAVPGFGTAQSDEETSACRIVRFEGTSLTHCMAVPGVHRVVTDLAADNGTRYRSLKAMSNDRQAAGVAFAMNAGMFNEDGSPLGYFVERSARLEEVNTGNGQGDFYSKPNGIFYGTGDEWQVRTTPDFLENVRRRPGFGTQSGPMLVIAGDLHPDILPDGPERVIRNGVGMDRENRAHFVISNEPVSFGRLARYFRDELQVRNALYLDGEHAALWDPASGRLDEGAPIGPMVVVEKLAGAN